MTEVILGKFYLFYVKALMNHYDVELDRQRQYARHHIVPKSYGGEDAKANLVPCTRRQHVVLHKLLYRYNQSRDFAKMVVAVSNLAREGVYEKIREKSIGWKHTSEAIAKMKGRKVTDEAKRHLSEIHKGKPAPHTKEQNEKIAKAKTGKHNTEEHIQHVIEGRKKYFASPAGIEARKKMSEERKGKNTGVDSPSARPVIAINEINGEVCYFDTVRDCANYFGLYNSWSTISRRIKRGTVSSRGSTAHWRLEYVS